MRRWGHSVGVVQLFVIPLHPDGSIADSVSVFVLPSFIPCDVMMFAFVPVCRDMTCMVVWVVETNNILGVWCACMCVFSVCAHVCVCTRTCACVCLCACVCVCRCMCVCTCIMHECDGNREGGGEAVRM